MEEKEILEGNKLIAEFMGMKQGKDFADFNGRWSGDWFDAKNAINGCRNEILSFHSDWNWLMAATHKCLFICHELMLNEWEDSFSDKFLACGITPMRNEVIQFINWYNSNK
jgi:hypothetical protein